MYLPDMLHRSTMARRRPSLNQVCESGAQLLIRGTMHTIPRADFTHARNGYSFVHLSRVRQLCLAQVYKGARPLVGIEQAILGLWIEHSTTDPRHYTISEEIFDMHPQGEDQFWTGWRPYFQGQEGHLRWQHMQMVSLEYLKKYLMYSPQMWYTDAPIKAGRRQSSNLVTLTAFSRLQRSFKMASANYLRKYLTYM